MLNKLYDKIKEIIYLNHKLILSFFILLSILTFHLPFYINTPGGIIDISQKIEIENSYDVEGSFNFAYVLELKATIPTMIIAYFNKDWDILKKEEVIYENESDADAEFRDHLLLTEANQTAVIVAYNKANKKVVVSNEQLFVTYVDSKALSDLKVGDEIIEINGELILNKEHLSNVIGKNNIGDTINIKVKRDSKTIDRTAEIMESRNKKVIGIMVSRKCDLVVEPNIKLNFNASESGPSGGLMMSLAIYNYLTEEDITYGKKIVGTGTIDEYGNVGSIGGVEYKLKGIAKEKASVFLVPAGENYDQAIKLKNEKNYDIEIVAVSTFDEALEYLKGLSNN
jgi:PDZ domain-containing protein